MAGNGIGAPDRAARTAHLAVGIAALLGLALSFAGMGQLTPGVALLGRAFRFWGFFTNLSNALVAICALGCAIPTLPWHRWAARPGVRTAIAVYILVVGVVFQLLLAGLIRLSPLGWWGNLLVHQIVPVAWILCWLGFGPHGGIGKADPAAWLIFPLAYAGWTVVHGIETGWFPYPFLDAGKLGWPVVARNMLLLTLFFAALSWGFRWIDGRLAKRTPA